MKKLFTIDDIMVAFVASLGYGFCDAISAFLGLSPLASMAVSFVLGVTFEETIGKIAFSKYVQEDPKRRVFVYVTFVALFLVGHVLSTTFMGKSMIDYLFGQLTGVVVMPIIGFFFNMCIRAFHIMRIRERYGDGDKGFVFDIDKEDIEEANQQNKPITGPYDSDCAVRTRYGTYVGCVEGDVLCFFGIPYAKPPVGERRWKAPEPLDPSDGVFEAKNFGASAVQVDHPGSILKHHRQSEDCLTLNVCVKDLEAKAKRPVVVLFHNGDFTYGGSADPLMAGDAFVAEHPDVIFVSFNFRLSIFGFIDFAEVPGGQAAPDAANLGLLDQIAALRWVHENIAAFGGDPGNVSVLGFGMGADSICLLATTDEAKGLFVRAFAFNGSPAVAYDTPDVSRGLAKDLLKETGTTSFEELMRLDTEALKHAAQGLWQSMCSPTLDGKLLPRDPFKAYEDGIASDIDFIVGIPSGEANVYKAFVGDKSFEDLLDKMEQDIQKEADESILDKIRKFYETEAAVKGETEAATEVIEQWNALCVLRGAAKLSAGGGKVRLMYWDGNSVIENLGTGTIDTVAALLGNDEASELYGSIVDADVSEMLQALLYKFVCGQELQLYHNEIKGIDEFVWKEFPLALIIAGESVLCASVENRLSEIEGFLEYAVE